MKKTGCFGGSFLSERTTVRAVVKCPKSGNEFEVEIPQTAVDVSRLWRQTIEASCPHCGACHLEGFKQLYVQAVLGGNNWGDGLSAPQRPGQRRQNALR